MKRVNKNIILGLLLVSFSGLANADNYYGLDLTQFDFSSGDLNALVFKVGKTHNNVSVEGRLGFGAGDDNGSIEVEDFIGVYMKFHPKESKVLPYGILGVNRIQVSSASSLSGSHRNISGVATEVAYGFGVIFGNSDFGFNVEYMENTDDLRDLSVVSLGFVKSY